MSEKQQNRRPDSQPGNKSCAACGRTIEWRRKWTRDWQNVRYCSDACRSNKSGDLDKLLETAILELLQQRGAGKTICPSEAARKVAPAAWEPLLEQTRQAARRLVAAGEIVITQGGVVVDPSRAKGAIRLRRR
jgi:hypothetical protein